MDLTTPLNVWSQSDEEIGRRMSNFAPTPFVLDGVEYASVEGFYVALLTIDPARRERIRTMTGLAAKHRYPKRRPESVEHGGRTIVVGSAAHVDLVKRAIRAKLAACPDLARAFAATHPRPLAHETGHPDPPDAEFPKEVFCRVLTELRDELVEAGATS